jgi:hypothetical protein
MRGHAEAFAVGKCRSDGGSRTRPGEPSGHGNQAGYAGAAPQGLAARERMTDETWGQL